MTLAARSLSTAPSLDFGNQTTGSTSPARSLTLTNGGDAPLTISNLVTSNTVFRVTDPVDPTADFTIAPGDSKIIKLTFSPTSGGAVAASKLTITSNAANTTTDVSLTGTGVPYAAELSATSLAFGDQLKDTDVTQSVTVKNVSGSSLSLSSIAVGGDPAFTLTSPASDTVAAGAQSTLSVKFRPTAANATSVSGSLTFNITGDPSKSSATVALSGRGLGPILEMDPVAASSVDFGDQRVGVSATRTVHLKNTTGTAPITITSFTLMGSSAFTIVSPSGPSFTLPAGGSQDVVVQFQPAALSSAVSTDLTIGTSDPDYTGGVVTFTGRGVKPILVVDPAPPSPLDFGNQRASTSVSKPVHVRNDGNQAITLSFALSGNSAFSVTSPTGASFALPPGGTQDVVIQFLPTTPMSSAVTGTLTFTSSDSDYSSTQVSLTGRGVKPNLVLDPNPPTPLDFGSQRVGVAATQTVHVKNTAGTGPITITSFTVSGDASFSVKSPSGSSFTIPAGGSQDVVVQFLPTTPTATAVTGTLNLVTSDTDYPGGQVPLTGRGVKPNLVLDPNPPTPLDFGDVRVGVAATRPVHLKNTAGTGPITITSLSVTGNAAFSVTSPKVLPFTIPAGGSQDVVVQFLPTALMSSPVTGNLNLVTSDTDYPGGQVPLTGRGVKPILVVDPVPPAPLDFGNQRVGLSASQQVHVRNDGNQAITLNFTLSGSSAFSITSPTGSSLTLPPGAYQDVGVQFLPPTPTSSAVTGILTFTSSDPDYGTTQVPLTGRGVKPNLVLDPNPPTPLDFGSQRVGVAATQTVHVKNTAGTGPITITSFTVSGDASFSVKSPSGSSFTIPAGGSQDVVVQFLPTTPTATAVTGTLNLVTSDTDYPGGQVPLTGRGVKPNLVLDPAPPTPLDFGDQRVGVAATQTVHVKNTAGTGPITITSFSVTGNAAFSVTSPTGSSFTIPAGGSQDVVVQFLPTVTADTVVTGNLNLVTSDADYPGGQVPLTGRGVKPILVVDPAPPAPLDFGNQRVSTSVSKSVHVRNNGNQAITLNFALSGNSAFSITSPTGASFTLSPGGTQELVIRFLPSTPTPSAVTGTLTFTSSDPDYGTTLVPLTGRGVKPNLVLDPNPPTPLNFGDQRVGVAATQIVHVKNTTGTGPITITSFTVSGDTSFSVTSPSGSSFTIPAGSTQDVVIKFFPATPMDTAVSGSLNLVTSDTDYPGGQVPLTGRGVKPNLVLDPAPPTPLNFGDQRVGVAATQTVHLKNTTGTGSITITSFSVTGNAAFSVTSPTGSSFTIPAGSSQDVVVQFLPTTPTDSAVTGNLNISTSDADYTGGQVALSGRGIKPVLELSPSPLSFGDQRIGTSVSLPVHVRNSGNGPITITSFTLTGASTFSLVSPTVTSFTVPAGTTQDVVVQFLPTTAAVTSSATLAFTTSDGDYASRQVSISGRGVVPILVLDPADTLAFGEQRVNVETTQTVHVRNTGSGPITITKFQVTGDTAFSIFSPSGSTFTVPGGGVQDVRVRFLPTIESVSSVTGFLNLETADTDYPSARVALSGRGVKPTLSVDTRTVSFGSQNVGVTSAAQTVTLKNVGSGTLRLSGITVTGGPFTVAPDQPVDLTTSPQTLSITFQPTDTGTFNGSATFTTNDPDNATVSISLQGKGSRLLDVKPLAPAAVDFGLVPKGTTSVEKEITFTNYGTKPIQLKGVSSISSQFNYNPSSLSFPVTLQPGSSTAVLKVSFSPTSTGTATGTITVESDADNGPHTVNLTGQGSEPLLQIVLPHPGSTLDFGDVSVGSPQVQPVELKNVGNATLKLNRVSITASSADGGTTTSTPFSYLGPPSSDIPPGTSLQFNVNFSPKQNEESTASLVLETNVSATPSVVILKGNGVAADMSLSPSALTFVAQQVNHGRTEQSLIINNTGQAELVISSFSVDNPDFTVKSPAAPLTLPKYGSVPLVVSFNPSHKGTVTGTLSILSNVLGPARTVSLSGVGQDGQLSASPSDLVFMDPVEVGSALGATQQVTLTNASGSESFTLKLMSATVSGTDSPFSITGFRSGLDLAPGQSDSFSVTFRPTVPGDQKGTIVITTNSELNPTLNVTVSGTGQGAQIYMPRTTVSFGKSNVGDSVNKDLLVNNIGQKTLQIWDVSFDNGPSATDGGVVLSDGGTDDMSRDFEVVDKTPDGGNIFPMMVLSGGSANIPLKFTPSQVGTRQARAVITSNAVSASASVNGEGTQPILTPSATTVRFDGVVMNTTSIPKTLTLTNTGTGSITIGDIKLDTTPGSTAFRVINRSLPVTLGSNGSLDVLITFSPTDKQLSAASTLQITPSGSGSQISVQLVGVGVRYPISLEPELPFGKQLISAASLPHKLHLANNTDTDITLASMTPDGAGCPQFKVELQPTGTSIPVIVKHGTTQEMAVTFTPASETAVNCTLAFSFAELPDPVSVALSGQGILHVLSIDPLDFGGVRVGSDRLDRQLLIKNLSSDNVTLNAPVVAYTTGEPFILDRDALKSVVIEPGVPLSVTVSYQPKVVTLSETTLAFGTLIPKETQDTTVTLTGKATQRVLSVNPAQLDFGRVDIKAAATTHDITVTNNSAQTQRVTVAMKTPTGSPYSVQPSDLTSIPAGESITFTVSFAPPAAGSVDDEVQVLLQGITEPELTIPVTGIGRILTGNGSGCSTGSTEAGGAGVLLLIAVLLQRSRRRRE